MNNKYATIVFPDESIKVRRIDSDVWREGERYPELNERGREVHGYICSIHDTAEDADSAREAAMHANAETE